MTDVKLREDVAALTGLRGVAALYVVIHHYSGPGTTFLAHGYLAVDLFFVLSGFVMALSYRHMFANNVSTSAYFKFIGRRFARIYPIYILSTVAAFILIFLGLRHGIRADAASPIIWAFMFTLNAFLVQGWGLTGSINDPTWSLSAEWAAYILFPVLLTPCLFRKAAAAWVFALLSVGLLLILCIIPLPDATVNGPLDITTYHYELTIFRCLPEFSLGLLAFRLSDTKFGQHLRADPYTSPLICLAIFILLFVPRSDFFAVLLFPPLIVTLASGSVHLPGRLLSSALADLLGRLSYSIYLIHTLCSDLIGAVDRKFYRLHLLHGHAAGTFTALLVTFVISYITYTYIEVPSRAGLRTLFEGKIT